MDPVGSPKSVILTRQGFDTSGAPVTFTEPVLLTTRVRQPYPNDATLDASRVALSEHVYSTDTIVGGSATNNSTIVPPKVLAHWATVPFQRATGTSFDVEVAAIHRHGRKNSMVACVKFTAKGRTSGAIYTQTVATMVASNQPSRTGYKVPVYRFTVPLAGFAQGEMVDVSFVACPWVGAAFDSTVEGVDRSTTVSPRLNKTLPFLCDKAGTYGGALAYVSPTSGNDSTGIVSLTAATAKASPFATIKGAGAALSAFNGNSRTPSHGDAGGGVMYLMAGTYAGPGSGGWFGTAPSTWVTITRDPAATRAQVILTNDTGALGNNRQYIDKVRFYDITLQAVTASSYSSIIAWMPDKSLWVDTTDIIGLGTNASGPTFYQPGLVYVTNATATNLGQFGFTPFDASQNQESFALVAGSVIQNSGSHPFYASFGNRYVGTSTNGDPTVSIPVSGTTGYPANKTWDGSILLSSRIDSLDSAPYAGVITQNLPISVGVGIVQCVFERISQIVPVLYIGADGSNQPIGNVVLAYNTTVGARNNELYNDQLDTSAKSGASKFNLWWEVNIKRDTFNDPTNGKNGTRVGNWPWSFGVNHRGNVSIKSASDGTLAVSKDSWNGDYFGLGGTPAAGQAATGSARPETVMAFTSYQARSTDVTGNNGTNGAGGGDYHIGNGSAARGRVPTGLAMLPFDLDGLARRNDGTGAAGAYETVQ